MTIGRSSSYPLVASYLTLRRIVGWIAVLLPVVLVAAKLVLQKQLNIPVQWPGSISGFYYTGMRDVLVGSLCALGVFLLGYRGYDRADFWITFAAGLCAIGVALFPTRPACQLHVECVTSNQKIISYVHDVFAIVLITLMGVMALRFAKSVYQRDEDWGTTRDRVLRWLGFANQWPQEKEESLPSEGEAVKGGNRSVSPSTRLKRHRNWWYRASATVTLICAAIFLIQAFTPWLNWFTDHIPAFLFAVETVAIFSFGIAWFVKGRSLLSVYRKRLLGNQILTHVEAAEHGLEAGRGEDVRTRLAAGTSASQTATELGISRQRVSEIAAEIT